MDVRKKDEHNYGGKMKWGMFWQYRKTFVDHMVANKARVW
jgi:hypothetical protein